MRQDHAAGPSGKNLLSDSELRYSECADIVETSFACDTTMLTSVTNGGIILSLGLKQVSQLYGGLQHPEGPCCCDSFVHTG